MDAKYIALFPSYAYYMMKGGYQMQTLLFNNILLLKRMGYQCN